MPNLRHITTHFKDGNPLLRVRTVWFPVFTLVTPPVLVLHDNFSRWSSGEFEGMRVGNILKSGRKGSHPLVNIKHVTTSTAFGERV